MSNSQRSNIYKSECERSGTKQNDYRVMKKKIFVNKHITTGEFCSRQSRAETGALTSLLEAAFCAEQREKLLEAAFGHRRHSRAKFRRQVQERDM